jgi:hypothetical protein
LQAELCDDLSDQQRNRCPVSKARLARVEERRILLTYFAEPAVLACLKWRWTLMILRDMENEVPHDWLAHNSGLDWTSLTKSDIVRT